MSSSSHDEQQGDQPAPWPQATGWLPQPLDGADPPVAGQPPSAQPAAAAPAGGWQAPAGMAQAPPQHSQDGRWWWDGQQWRPVPGPSGPPAGARRTRTGLVIGVVVGVVVLVGAVFAVLGTVAFQSRQDRAAETLARTDLATLRVAQAVYAVDAGAFATDLATLRATVGLDLAEPETVTLLWASADNFCASAAVPGQDLVYYTDAAGELGTDPCG